MNRKYRIYNIYPKLIGKMADWVPHFDRIRAMNFDWIYVNPLSAPGFSGSDYAVSDYYAYHPLYVAGDMDFSRLDSQRETGNNLVRMICREAGDRGMGIIFDLVINHTAVDSDLTRQHPAWYVRKPDGTIVRPGCLSPSNEWIEWGDLAEIDNEGSPDRDALWQYWLDLTLFYCSLGVKGFRCDAAYKVPTGLWKYLISRVKSAYPDTVFIGETIGCKIEEAAQTASGGFDILMNSLKWWDYKDEWFMREYAQLGNRYATLTFPENHDTERMAREAEGNRNLVVMKYAIGAYFCTGIATTIGFEFGFRRKIDVVQTNPSWWETAIFDISADIGEINRIKGEYAIFNEDSVPRIVELGDDMFCFIKTSRDGSEKVMVVANTNGHQYKRFRYDNLHGLMTSRVIDISHGYKMPVVPNDLEYHLYPGEVKVFYANGLS